MLDSFSHNHDKTVINFTQYLFWGRPAISVINFAAYVENHASCDAGAVAIMGADGKAVTYRELAAASASLAQWLSARKTRRLGLLADRTAGAYVGVIAAAWGGMSYVPFSLKAPPERLKDQFVAAGCQAMLIDGNGLKILTGDLIAALPDLVVAVDEQVRQALADRGVTASVVKTEGEYQPPVAITGEEEAYLIFTSGSSGTPKGVVVSTGARDAYVKAFQQRHPLGSDERVAQPCDLSWDLSVGNIVISFSNGASLYLMGRQAILAPARFIILNRITVWHSVPTLADMLLERGTLQPGIFSSLHLTSFIGAPFFAKTALAWQIAAPDSVLVNSYGPTEMTVECLDYTLPAGFDQDEVPIGTACEKTETLIVREDGTEAGADEVGELLLAGPQQADGYLDDPARTDAAFIWREDGDGQKKRWYRTGDLVTRNADGLYFYRGRLDHQIKVLGYRVELEEIETQLRKVAGVEQVVVSGYPFGRSAVDELIGFIVLPAGGEAPWTTDGLREKLGHVLPAYMLPTRFFSVEALPRTANGKLDRKALSGCVEAGHAL